MKKSKIVVAVTLAINSSALFNAIPQASADEILAKNTLQEVPGIMLTRAGFRFAVPAGALCFSDLLSPRCYSPEMLPVNPLILRLTSFPPQFAVAW